MTLDYVDNLIPVIPVELMPSALERHQRRQRKSLRQCHPMSVWQYRVLGAVYDERRDAHFIEPTEPLLP
jgi:hypothetical protein